MASSSRWLDPDVYPNEYFYLTSMNGHRCGVLKDCDWGGPCDWQAVCSCGWSGVVFTDASSPGDRPAGSPGHALAEMLVHAGFDPDVYAEQVSGAITQALVRVRELSLEPVSGETLDAIDELVRQVRLARKDLELVLSAWSLRSL